MSEHTKGPWDYEAGFLITRAFAGGAGIPLFGLNAVSGSEAEIEANARLLTTAPDALLLAHNIVAFAEVEELSEGVEVTIPPAAAALILKMAERLIAKAEAQQ